MNNKCFVICGPSGTGKTEFAKLFCNLVKYKYLSSIIHLDGDDLRSTVNSDLGFSDEDISENMRRIVGIKDWLLNTKQTRNVIVSVIAPHYVNREYLRANGFYVIFLNRPDCYKEDKKGLYASGKQVPFEETRAGDDVDTVIDWGLFDIEKEKAEASDIIDLTNRFNNFIENYTNLNLNN